MTITEECTHCHATLPQGKLARVWENRWFCNELEQASWMLYTGRAHQKPAPEEYTSEYGYCIFKGQTMTTYKEGLLGPMHLFTDFYEFKGYVDEHLGRAEVVGENAVAM